MAKNRPLKVTARVVQAALEKAEAELVRPAGSDALIVDLRPSEVETRVELFQPRKFSEGLKDVDPKHVKDLGIRIGKKGELDPVVVVKLGTQWVCVDGHHRLAAYVTRKWQGTVRCEWFQGSALEARDASVQLNEVVKLPMQQSDRFEEAWKRVVLGQGSKAEIVRLTGASDGMVALMRRVVVSFKAQDVPGQRLKTRINDLAAETWSFVRSVWVGLEAGEYDANEEAAKLARILVNRLTNKLSRNPEVTARALWMYDQHLCEPLSSALNGVVREEAALEAKAQMEQLTTPDDPWEVLIITR